MRRLHLPPQAILIPRTRFAPVKTTADMLALMSDAYGVTEDYRMELKPERNGIPPNIKLGALPFGLLFMIVLVVFSTSST